MKRVPFPAIVVATILAYAAIHLPEEALGNFPAIMGAAWGMPQIKIGYAQWLFHNAAIFMPVLLAGLLVFCLSPERFAPIGLGIPLWGAANFIEHLICTVKGGSVFPGLFSSILFMALAVLALLKLRSDGALTRKNLLLGVAAMFAYWALPIGLILILAPRIASIFA
jgi:hypothetical protein